MSRKHTMRFAAGAMAGLMAAGTVSTAATYNVLADEVIAEWREENGEKFWYENGVKQGTEGRGKEIYDPGSDAWYWLDAVDGGKMAVSKDVYQESQAGQWGAVTNENGEKVGKWVRYDANGHMVKGWDKTEAGTYYFDPVYGTMAKGAAVIDGQSYYFNRATGILERAGRTDDDGNSFQTDGWHKVGGVNYWYENGVRQGVKYNADGSIDTSYRGKEIYDPSTDAWYWLDCVQNGAVAKDKDVYQESGAGQWGAGTNENGEKVGKWVRYDADGHMVKGWAKKDGARYYFDPVYGTMARGTVSIDGKSYEFGSVDGKLVREVVDDNNDNNNNNNNSSENNNGSSDNKDSLEWSISADEELTVTGGCEGKLYTEEKDSYGNTVIVYPWDEYKDKIKSAYINVTGLTDMQKMFEGCSELRTADLSDLDTSRVKNMNSMFSDCSKLSSVDLSSFDTGRVENMNSMFSACSSLSNVDIRSFDTGSVTDMGYMFRGCSELSSLDLNGFDTGNVTDMSGMFAGCSELESLDLTGFDTGSVTDMTRMFLGCSKLKNVYLSSFDTSKVTSMYAMFSGCSKLSSVDLSGFDTGSVTDMPYMFSGCSELRSADLSSFDTSKVTSMYNMFSDCSKLISVDLSSFDTGKVTDMFWMFSGCSELGKVDLSSFDTGSAVDMSYMFYGCKKLTKIMVGSGWNTSSADTGSMFYGCGTGHVTVK